MQNKLILQNITISESNPPLIVPEIGINHNGSLELAKIMVDAAISAGAKIIKHQTHIVEDEMSNHAKNVIPGNAKESIYEIMKKCALNLQDEIRLKEYVESKGAVFLSTPFSRAAANRLEDMGVCAFKIGSGECNNYPLLRHIAQFKKPIILSTGMNDLTSIAKSVEIFRESGVSFALLHTTNLYPTPVHLVRLNAMLELKNEFDCLVGLSDHTTSNLSSLGAIALGACIIERHFTDSMERVGPDIICSNDTLTLKQLIQDSEELFMMRGDFQTKETKSLKYALKEEQVTMDFAFASIVSIKPIKKGDVFSTDNIWVKRPGIGGIPASEFESLLGKKALRDIENDKQISKEDF